MPMPITGFRPSGQRERGTVLLVALMFLIVLTLLGLSAMNATTLEEKMAGNSRDYNVALQAAEAALRDAESDLKGTGVIVGATCPTCRALTVSQFPVGLIGSANPSGCNTAGLCIIVNETTQLYDPSKPPTPTPAVPVNWGGTSTTVYGTYTGATPIRGVAQAPRYVIELMQFADGKNKDRVTGASGSADYYYVRITAQGWGATTLTHVYLQEVFIIALPT